MLLDGAHLVEEALASRRRASTWWRLQMAIVDAAPRDSSTGCERAGVDVVGVTAQVLAAMSPVTQPSGVVALAARDRALLLDEVLRRRAAAHR